MVDHTPRMSRPIIRKSITYFLKRRGPAQKRTSHLHKRMQGDGKQPRLARDDKHDFRDETIPPSQRTEPFQKSVKPHTVENDPHALLVGENEDLPQQNALVLFEKGSRSEPSDVSSEGRNALWSVLRDGDGNLFCQCNLDGCQRCYPGDCHAAHCGLSSCKDCADLGPGYDEWHVSQTAPNTHIFTSGDSVLSRTFDGKKNVLSLVVARRVLEGMRNSVIEGRRYRKTKNQIDAELDITSKEAQPAWQEYQRAIADLRELKKELGFAYLPHFQERAHLIDARKDVRRAQLRFRAIKTRERRLRSRLRDAEHIWWTSFWDLDHYNELILEDAGLVPDDGERHWRTSDYRYHRRIRSQYYGDDDVYDGEDTNTESSSRELNYTGGSTQNEAAIFRNEWMEYLAGFEARLHYARQQYDEARGNHGPLLAYYCHDNPGRDLEELKDEYGPQFVERTRERIKTIQEAEEALANARVEAWGAGIDPYAENDYDLKCDEKVQEYLIAQDVEKLIANVDRGKITRWLENFRRYEPWPVLKLDSDGGFGSETTSVVSSSSTKRSDSSGSQLCDRVGSKPHHHSLKRSKLMVGDVNLDSISVFNDYDYIRRNIDSWATEKRGGYL